MKDQEYFGLGADIPRGNPEYIMSRTELVTFGDCPWEWRQGKSFDGSPSTEWGSLVDVMFLTPDEFSNRYTLRPKTYPAPTKANPDLKKPWSGNSNWCKNWMKEAEASGKEVVNDFQLNMAKKALAVLLENDEAQAIFGNADKQVFCQWEYFDEDTGITVPLKCLIDGAGIDDPYLADFKTSRDPRKHKFRMSAKYLRYDIQAAFYLDGYRECFEARDNFAFIVQSNSSPFSVASYYLEPSDIEVGRNGRREKWGVIEGYLDMLKRYCRCLADDHWPSHTETLEPLEIYK
jgi:hypothetical protein